MTLQKTLLSSSLIALTFAIAWMFMGVQNAHAATITWDNGGADGLWSTAANWSGDAIPGSADDVVFDVTSTDNSTQDIATKLVLSVSVNSGYTGTLTVTEKLYAGTGGFTLNAGTVYNQRVIRITDGTFTQTAGTFNSDAYDYIELYNSSDFTISGGTFSSNSDILWGGTGTSTVDINSTLTIGDWYQFYNNDSDGVTIAAGDVIIVNEDIDISGNSDLDCGAGAHIETKYRLNLNNSTTTTGTCTVKFTGTSAQRLVSGSSVNLDIEVDSTNTVLFYSTTSINGTFTLTAGTLDTDTGDSVTIASGGSIVQNGGTWTGGGESLTVTGTYTLAGGTFNASSVTTTVSSGGLFTVSGGTFNRSGIMDIDGTLTMTSGAVTGGSSAVQIAGTVNVNGGTYTVSSGTTLIDTGGTLSVGGGTFAGAAGTLDVNGTLSMSSGTTTLSSGATNISGYLTTTGGTLAHGSGTVLFDGTGATVDLEATKTLNTVTINLTGGTDTLTIASGDILAAAGLVTLTNGLLSGKLEAQANVTAGSGFDGGAGPLYFANSAVQAIGGGGNLPGLEINKSGGTLTFNDNTSGIGTDADILLTQGDVILPTGQWFWSYGGFTMNGGTLTCQGTGFWDVNEFVTINGGTWTGGSYYSGVYAGPFTMTGGIFNVGTDGYEVETSFSLSGGTFNAGSGSEGVNVFADFSHTGGTFNADTSSVKFDTTTSATVTGDTTFYNLTMDDAKQITFNAGDTTTITNNLSWTGGQTLVSSASGSPWYLTHTGSGTQTVTGVSVGDSNASGGNAIASTQSVNLGNNVNWLGLAGYSEAVPGIDPELSYIGVTETPYQAEAVFSPGLTGTIYWDSVGAVDYVTLYYSPDGGTTFERIVDNFINAGRYTWNVPEGLLYGDILLKIELTDQAIVVDSMISDPVTVGEYISPAAPNEAPGGDVETPVDEPVVPTEPEETTIIDDILALGIHSFFRTISDPSVYYRFDDTTRRSFLNSKIFFTWADSFDIVEFATGGVVSQLNLGAPMLPKPGVTLVQFETSPHVYATFEDPDDNTRVLLRRVVNAETAAVLYGDSWETYILELPTTFWSRFTMGEDIDATGVVDTSRMRDQGEFGR